MAPERLGSWYRLLPYWIKCCTVMSQRSLVHCDIIRVGSVNVLCGSGNDCCSPSCFAATVASPGEKDQTFPLCHFLIFLRCHSNLNSVSFSPIKVLNFENHFTKLQADSNYLLSDEYEVSFYSRRASAHLHGNTEMTDV